MFKKKLLDVDRLSAIKAPLATDGHNLPEIAKVDLADSDRLATRRRRSLDVERAWHQFLQRQSRLFPTRDQTDFVVLPRQLQDEVNGLLVDFLSPTAITDRIVEALEHQEEFRGLRERARQTAIERFDLTTVCLPQHLALINRLVSR
jgi:hypothetical protein